MGEILQEIRQFSINLAAFFWAICCLIILPFNYIGIKISNFLFKKATQLLYPNVDFFSNPSCRTLTDTHRNQGVRCVLLEIEGPIEIDSVKRHLTELVNRKDKFGKPAFPRLTQKLESKFGTYIWVKRDFKIEQHMSLAPYGYKGRTITEYNIQEFVSEVITKSSPPVTPTWHLMLIPSSENKHYMLVRIHHALHEDGVNIADLLPLIPPVRSGNESCNPTSPLMNVFKKPEKIPLLIERLTEDFTNHWNEFISNYDPMEKPELLKNNPGFYQFLAIFLITMVSTIREIRKGVYGIKPDIFSKLNYLKATWKKEAWKRRVNLHHFLTAIWVTSNPLNVTKVFFDFWFKKLPKTISRIPVIVYNEAMAIFTCITMQHCSYPNTYVYTFYSYFPLFFFAGKEFFSFFKTAFESPKIILRECFSKYQTIQTFTLCGRKVVAWSKPVKNVFIQQLSQLTGLSETEVVLAAVSQGIGKVMSTDGGTPPSDVPITCRSIDSSYLFTFGSKVKPEYFQGGFVALNLPMFEDKLADFKSVPEKLASVRQNFAKAREEQSLTFLVTLMHLRHKFLNKVYPQGVITVFLKYLSKKFCVSFTEVLSKQRDVFYYTMWGQQVSSVLYFSPPQANISVSICLNQYGDSMVLGTMCDAQLSPKHHLIARHFKVYLDNIARGVGYNTIEN